MRFIAITTIGLMMTVGGYATEFVIGGSGTGLTSTYVSSGCATSNGPSFSGCISNTPVFGTRRYTGTVFTGATLGTNTVLPPSGSTWSITDPFNNQSITLTDVSGTYQAWGPPTTGTPNLIIPVGVYGANQVATMIQNQWGAINTATISVTFNFSATSNGSTSNSVTYYLTNGDQVRAGVNPLTGCSAAPCNNFATTLGGPAVTGDAYSNVAAVNVWSSLLSNNAGYTAFNSSGNPFNGTTGNLMLDAQVFDLSGLSYASSSYLTQIVIGDLSNTANVSRAIISGVTVETGSGSVAPEPGTVLLSLAGLGALGIARWRRRK